MLAKFPESKVTEEVWNALEHSYLSTIIYYMIDHKFRTSVQLSSWIKGQVDLPSIDLAKIGEEIPSHTNTDKQMLEILRYVRKNVTYKSDTEVWEMPERWQTGVETLKLKTGDCEDGAILMYLLARYKGIPANRLLLLCGSVNGGGHCWLGYRPNAYPLDFVFLDWCYFVNLNEVPNRPKFSIIDNTIYEYSIDNEITPIRSNYYNIWFAFNELHSYKVISYEYR